MDLATFNRFRLTGDTRTTQALDALYRARPAAVVAALSTTRPFGGLPEPFLIALRQRGLSTEELDHIRDWPDKDKERVRAAVLNAINTNRTVHFAWKLYDGSKERTTIRTAGPGAITITFFSPWSNVRAVGRDDVTVDVSP
jgi:hypothetical protein